MKKRLWKEGPVWGNLLADAGYSSGENYDFLERNGLTSYIPHGTYKGGPEGFTYVEEGNYWGCPDGSKLVHRDRKKHAKGLLH